MDESEKMFEKLKFNTLDPAEEYAALLKGLWRVKPYMDRYIKEQEELNIAFNELVKKIREKLEI